MGVVGVSAAVFFAVFFKFWVFLLWSFRDFARALLEVEVRNPGNHESSKFIQFI
jgi:hypothetical protein